MSDYDSGDDLFDGVDADELVSPPVQAAQKRKPNDLNEPDDDACLAKRARLQRDDAVSTVALRILTDKFGYTAFRHEQAAAIARLLRGDNTLVIFPTGAGKSLCYQVC
jgi:superfamily II DNA helicase RecQ